jgi:hypothetical protein
MSHRRGRHATRNGFTGVIPGGCAVLLVVALATGPVPAGAAAVTPPHAASASDVVVSVGYADGTGGLSPWEGSPGTTFIGEPAQCCLTHGPDDGAAGYDGGAIELNNTGATSVSVDSVAVDFGGGSSPAAFDLWGDGTSPQLPQTLAPGANLVLTMTSSFNFDTSDLFGEACHIDSGVVPVVQVTIDGVEADYDDSHQILNSDGADLASCPTDVSEQHPFTAIEPGDQPDAAPVNEVAPSLTVAGSSTAPTTPAPGRVVSGFAGGWNASPPPTLSLQWTRCDSNGNGCHAIPGATKPKFVPTTSDVGKRLRLQVVASNSAGSTVRSSAASAVVRAGGAVAQLGHTSTGFTSTFVDSNAELAWLEPATASGTTTDFAFFARGAGNNQAFTPRVYSTRDGQRGSLLGTGTTVTVPKGANGRWYVSKLLGVRLGAGSRYLFALHPSGSFNGTYVGSETDGEPSFFVDYTPIGSGYWMLGADGRVYNFGDNTAHGDAPGPAVALAADTVGTGYWVVDASGNVSHFGSAGEHGGRPPLRSGERVSAISATPTGGGYWLFTDEGRVFPFGDARWFGDLGARTLNGPVVASVATPTGGGYYMVGSDGGVFAFGDAQFRGSTGGRRLNRPVVGIAPAPDNLGYWLVASDGGVFSFNAPFRGSMGGTRLNRPVNGLIAYGDGYLMVASDGGVFDFSHTRFAGSLAGFALPAPILAIASANS